MKVTVIPIVIGTFGTDNKIFLKGLEELEIRWRLEAIQTTALLRWARILRRVLETRGNFLSLRKPSANAGTKKNPLKWVKW